MSNPHEHTAHVYVCEICFEAGKRAAHASPVSPATPPGDPVPLSRNALGDPADYKWCPCGRPTRHLPYPPHFKEMRDRRTWSDDDMCARCGSGRIDHAPHGKAERCDFVLTLALSAAPQATGTREAIEAALIDISVLCESKEFRYWQPPPSVQGVLDSIYDIAKRAVASFAPESAGPMKGDDK